MARPSKYGEKTVLMRIPLSMVGHVEDLLRTREVLQGSFERSGLPPAAEAIVSGVRDALIDVLGLMPELMRQTVLERQASIPAADEILNDLQADRVALASVRKSEADTHARALVLAAIRGACSERPAIERSSSY